jgi:titin
MEAAAPAITPDQVEQALTASATDLGAPGRDDLFGHGQVDAVRAVRAARALAGPVLRAPSAPRVGTPTPLAAAVRLSWSAPLDNGGAAITGYRVNAYRDTALVKSVVVDRRTTTATVTGLANGTAYRLGVEALNGAGYGPRSTLVTATPRTTPGAPKVTSVAAQVKAVAVRWAKPASTGGAPVTGYLVRVYSGGELVKTATAAAAATSLTVPGLTSGRAYAFRVLAKNAAGTGASSATSAVVRAR